MCLFQLIVSIFEGSQSRNLGARAEAEVIKKHCLPPCSPCFSQLAFLHSSGPCVLEVELSTVGQAFPCQFLIKKMLHRHTYRPVLWRYCLNCHPLLLDNSSLCHLGTKPTRLVSFAVFLRVSWPTDFWKFSYLCPLYPSKNTWTMLYNQYLHGLWGLNLSPRAC